MEALVMLPRLVDELRARPLTFSLIVLSAALVVLVHVLGVAGVGAAITLAVATLRAGMH